MFCPKCGSILVPKKTDSKKCLACSSCGYTTKDLSIARIKEDIRQKPKKIEIIKEDELETLPQTDVECPNCKHGKAYYWTVQTRAGDEPETKFLRCIKCKHIWRDYD